jgi:hypothetical protein
LAADRRRGSTCTAAPTTSGGIFTIAQAADAFAYDRVASCLTRAFHRHSFCNQWPHQLEIAMMRCFGTFAPRQAVRGSAVVLAAAILLAACGTGIAAFAGLLPQSDSVASAVTATPLVEIEANLMDLVESGPSGNPASSD